MAETPDPSPRRPWTSRKFWTAQAWEAVFVVLLARGDLPPDVFQTLTFVTIGGYLAANVAQRYVSRGR
ncbi:MAG TPA: hypothetical protein VKA48_03815 [Gammaproteobacteria bacterium]|nr:hypothetical protein [Gammaproteobacteria bacterium]